MNRMKIAVIGASCTKFGELWNKSLYDLLAESQINAISDAQINLNQIDHIFTGNMCGGMFSGQHHLGAMAADILNVNISSTVIEGACASGGLALRSGVMAIESGLSEVVLVNGVEKMTDLNSEQIATGLMTAASEEQEFFAGATFPGLNALIAKIYMDKYRLTRNDLAEVSVQNHKNGILNPLAHFRREVSLKTVLNSQIIADPLTIFDCAPISDGASSLILSTYEFAKKYFSKSNKKVVYIVGTGQASDTLSLGKRDSLIEFKANRLASEQTYRMANVMPSEIDIAEVHDAFTITQIIGIKDLNLTNKTIINKSGGLKAKGHPVGATGVSQAYEVVMQLRGDCGLRQVKNAKIGLTQNMGGCGSTSVVHIFSRD